MQGTMGPDFHTLLHTLLPYISPLPPHTHTLLPQPRDPWEASQGPARVGGRTGLVCTHRCVPADTPQVLGSPPQPQRGPAPVTWCQGYLGNWPFWLSVKREAKPLGSVEKRTVRELLSILYADFFKFQNYDGIFFFFWICFTNKPDWSISLLTDCLFVVT